LTSPITGGAVVAIVGTTASGKSALACRVAEAARRDGAADGVVELVSVDSMAVYRGMDIGTAKPTPAVRARIRYHLLDLVDPSEEFTVRQFQTEAHQAVADIHARGNRVLLVGGTGLYLRSVVDDLTFPGRFPHVVEELNLQVDAAGPPGSEGEATALHLLHGRLGAVDPVAAGRIEVTNRRRLLRALEVTLGSGRPFSSFGPGLESYPPTPIRMVGLRTDPAETDRRIADRVASMMHEGFLDEVRRLLQAPEGLSRTARQALGYRELAAHLEGGVPLDAAVEEITRRTRAFARRQWAWFRRDPRIVWMEPDDDPVARVTDLLDGRVRD
jgi:tRNA dimethylallyltransferase